MDFRRTAKLKYRLANNIFYRILNVSYIFLYNSWIYSECDNFQGCVTIGCLHFSRSITYHTSKIKNLNKISDIINIYLELKKDLKECIDFNPIIENFCCTIIEQVEKINLVYVNGFLLKIILIVTFSYKKLQMIE